MYRPQVIAGKLDAMVPVEWDPDPSLIGASIPEAITSPTRIMRPAVRRSYLAEPGAHRERRGLEPFVEVSWDVALELVARELKRVKTEQGTPSIFGGSYGWGSAGRFLHAQSQLHRFLNLFGGYVFSMDSYRLGARRVQMPHIVGNMALQLLSNQPKTRLHSQYDHGAYSRSSKIQQREPLTLNTADARARGVVDGDVVKVFNERGAFLAGMIVSDGIHPGVVQIATGAWFDPWVKGEPNSLDKHGNPNRITADLGDEVKRTDNNRVCGALIEWS